jgi:hypothetical protein
MRAAVVILRGQRRTPLGNQEFADSCKKAPESDAGAPLQQERTSPAAIVRHLTRRWA